MAIFMPVASPVGSAAYRGIDPTYLTLHYTAVSFATAFFRSWQPDSATRLCGRDLPHRRKIGWVSREFP
jgi:hypothetical protein